MLSRDLIENMRTKALLCRENSCSSYSNFKVGAAILTSTGSIIGGCNIESASYGLSICAERVALFTALSQGFKEFKAILIIADTSSITTPCGACRQLLMDYAPSLDIIMTNLDKKEKVSSIRSLLKDPFIF